MSLSLIGILTILTIVVLLIWNRTSPIVIMIILPVIGALIAGFSVAEIGVFFEDGIAQVMNVVVMFIFAIIFFGIMQDAGLFEPIINKMIALSGGNVVKVAVATVLIAAIGQLDGSGASTFLITVPALLPLYQRLKMNPYLLLLLVGGSAAIMNMVPWGGPMGRVASVLGMDVNELWQPLIPVQIVGLILMLGLAVFLGFREQRRIKNQYGLVDGAVALVVSSEENDEEDDEAKNKETDSHGNSLVRPKLIWVNLIVALAVIGVLVSGIIPSGFAFMMGVAVALLINYPNVTDQTARLRAHAPSALTMAGIILAAGLFLGVLTGSGMLDAISKDFVTILPEGVTQYIHLIVGILGIPFDMLLSTDAYYFALFPVIEQIASAVGIDSLSTAYAMIIGNIVGTFISPLAPAVWLALGLSGLEIGKHIRYSFFWLWGLSLVLIGVAVLFGIISI
ncbi:citrate transporter [Salinicoccus sediminis]|uniref:Citrate transporter n=1 Tax=Salinicoccus sediminis TaxID=1432562 RepID=A0A0M2SIE2_9STAP|nr:citrate:proton symporter [Salinicoccus sediminis]KKK33396.1 citrate transporter [Salinicoccus sediminis]